jgi:hypothetical protein
MEDKERFGDFLKLPKEILEFMNKLAETRFYKKTLENNKIYADENKTYENWCFMDFEITEGSYNDIKVIKIGELAHYQYDHEKAIVLDFVENKAYLTRGYAVDSWASKMLSNQHPIPKYMKEMVNDILNKYSKDKLKRR